MTPDMPKRERVPRPAAAVAAALLRSRPALSVILSLVLSAAASSAPLPPDDAAAKLDELKARLATLSDRDQPPVLNSIAELLIVKDPAQSRERAREAQKLAERFGLKWEEVRAGEILGYAAYNLREDDEARASFEKTLAPLRAFVTRPPAGVRAEEAKALLARGLEYRSFLAWTRNDHEEMVRLNSEALPLYRAVGNADRTCYVLRSIGQSYLFLGQYEKAMAFAIEALAEAEGSGNLSDRAQGHYLIGYVNRDMKNADKALEHFLETESLARRAGNRQYLCFALNEIGNIYVGRSDYSTARDYKERALREARALNDPYTISACLHDMAALLSEQKMYKEALPYYLESYETIRKMGATRDTLITVVSLGQTYLALGDPDEAVRRLEPALDEAEKIGLKKEILDLSLTLQRARAARKDYAGALEALNRAYAVRDEVYSEEMSRQTAEMQTRFETKKKEEQLARSRVQRNALVAISALVLVLAAALFGGYRIKIRANRKLESANLKIREKQDRLTEAYKKVEELARTDALTGLPNRRAMLETLEEEKVRFERNRRPFALVMTDLDRFKTINDTCGHDAGDYLLKACSGLIRSSLRKQDRVARWGGDEFLLLLPGTNRAGGRQIVEAVRKRIAETTFAYEGRPLKTGLSLGLAVYAGGLTIDDCIRRADEALYEDKSRRSRRR